jgi:hypothetical protein
MCPCEPIILPTRQIGQNLQKPSLTGDRSERYAVVLGEIRVRFDEVAKLKPWDWKNIEIAALHARKILELVVFGSLMNNQDAVAEVSSAFHKRDAASARRIIGAVNPQYWPEPVERIEDAPGQYSLRPLEGGFLREEDWGKAYGFLSDILHARSPFKPPLDVTEQAARVQGLLAEIWTLLSHHWIHLPEDDQALAAILRTPEGGIQVVPFEAVAPANGDAEADGKAAGS